MAVGQFHSYRRQVRPYWASSVSNRPTYFPKTYSSICNRITSQFSMSNRSVCTISPSPSRFHILSKPPLLPASFAFASAYFTRFRYNASSSPGSLSMSRCQASRSSSSKGALSASIWLFSQERYSVTLSYQISAAFAIFASVTPPFCQNLNCILSRAIFSVKS